ncbi:MAG: hypothetical protein JWQ07_4412 [Ramlibacter sp.]|nr:hypothetical protein [Ramlibacter sp.]
MKAFAVAARRWAARIAAVGALALVVSCGGGSQVEGAPPPAASVASAKPMAARLAAPALPTPDQAMDWAERRYPDLFPAAGKSPGTSGPYTYRYYPATNNYLGIATATSDVYIYGTIAPAQPTRVAPLSDYTCVIAPANCGLSTNIAAWGDSLTPPFAANLGVLFPSRMVYDGGISSQSSYDVEARVAADSARHGWISVFWFGHNNDSDPEQVKRDMAAAVATLAPGNDRFIVLSVLNKAIPTELKGTAMYNTILQLNADLAATYPQNYIDIRALLVSHYDPSKPQDVIDFQNDVMPASLRHDVDHLNNDGSVLVATRVQQFINAKAW